MRRRQSPMSRWHPLRTAEGPPDRPVVGGQAGHRASSQRRYCGQLYSARRAEWVTGVSGSAAPAGDPHWGRIPGSRCRREASMDSDVFFRAGQFGREVRRQSCDAGSVIGEQAFLDGLPRSATIRAVTDGRLMQLTPARSEVLLGSRGAGPAGAVLRRPGPVAQRLPARGAQPASAYGRVRARRAPAGVAVAARLPGRRRRPARRRERAQVAVQRQRHGDLRTDRRGDAAGLYGRRPLRGKSGWCSLVCPVLPVERLYNETPFVRVANRRCDPCVGCTKNCYDFNPLAANLSDAYDDDATWAGYRRLLAALFPGFRIAYFGLSEPTAIGLGAWHLAFALHLAASAGVFSQSRRSCGCRRGVFRRSSRWSR